MKYAFCAASSDDRRLCPYASCTAVHAGVTFRNICGRCAGINLTFELERVLELRGPGSLPVQASPRTAAGGAFLRLLVEDASAFQELYVASFALLDRLWLARRASYMDFPAVLRDTLQLVRRALQQRPRRVRDVCAQLDAAAGA